jgi:cytidine deaminase
MLREIHVQFEEFADDEQLTTRDRELVNKARQVTDTAYAPYSNFRVAAVARMNSGKIVAGTNQENASYPVGICAERTLLSAISVLYPAEPIDTIAVTYHNMHGDSSEPVSPCGICRQTLLEYEQRTGQAIRLILAGNKGRIFILQKSSDLLPLNFSADDMNK